MLIIEALARLAAREKGLLEKMQQSLEISWNPT
jgi:hypothetical protein